MERADAFELTNILHAEQGRGDPFAGAVHATRMPMVISDPRQHDNPIVFVNDAFLALCGFNRSEVMGRNCRFLQGPDTDQRAVAAIRAALAVGEDVSVELLNYRKDGTTFWNALYISPVFGESGELQFFFASQFDVTDRKDRELAALEGRDFFENAVEQRTNELKLALEQKTLLLHEVDHRVKNNLQMIASLIKSQARSSGDPAAKEALQSTLARVEALGSVHRRLYQSQDLSTFSVSDFIREIAGGLVASSGRSGIGLDLDLDDLDDLDVPAGLASPIALLVNELMTNSLKHGFPDHHAVGTLKVMTRTFADRTEIVVEDDGVGMAPGAEVKATFGRRLVESLVRQMRGQIVVTAAEPGTLSRVTIPNGHVRTSM